MWKSGILGSAAALALLSAASQADALIVQVTYQGVISDGADATGLFGTPGGVLDGQAFTANFGLDSTLGFSALNPPLSSSYNAGNERTPVSITINNRTVHFLTGIDGSGEHHTNSAGAGGVWGVSTNAVARAVDFARDPFVVWDQRMNLFLQSLTDPFVTSFDYRTPLSHSLQPDDTSGGHLSLSETAGATVLQDVTADLVPLSVQVSVPEPATWLLLIAGFGLAGSALRRRRAALASA